MVEADSHLKLDTTFILNMYKAVELIDMKLLPHGSGSSMAAVWWRVAMTEVLVAAWQRQRKCCDVGSAWWWRQQWQQQLGGSGSTTAVVAMGAMVLVPNLARHRFDVPYTNVPTHVHLNITNMPTYAPSSLVEEGGTTA